MNYESAPNTLYYHFASDLPDAQRSILFQLVFCCQFHAGPDIENEDVTMLAEDLRERCNISSPAQLKILMQECFAESLYTFTGNEKVPAETGPIFTAMGFEDDLSFTFRFSPGLTGHLRRLRASLGYQAF